MKIVKMMILAACLLLLCACGREGSEEPATVAPGSKPDDVTVRGLGLTEQDVIDGYVYILARYLVIRQEHIDLAEEGVDYNTKFNVLCGLEVKIC